MSRLYGNLDLPNSPKKKFLSNTSNPPERDPLGVKEYVHSLSNLYGIPIEVDLHSHVVIPDFKEGLVYSLLEYLKHLSESYFETITPKDKVIDTNMGRMKVLVINEASWGDMLDGISQEIIEALTGISVKGRRPEDFYKELRHIDKLPNLKEIFQKGNEAIKRFLVFKTQGDLMTSMINAGIIDTMEDYYQSHTFSPTEKRLFEISTRYLALIGFIFQDLYKITGEVNEKMTTEQIEQWVAPFYRDLKEKLDKNILPPMLVFITELIKITCHEKNHKWFENYEMEMKYGETDPNSQLRIKLSYLYEKYSLVIEKREIGTMIAKYGSIFLHRSKIPYHLTLDMLLVIGDNEVFCKKADQLLSVGKDLKWCYSDENIRDALAIYFSLPDFISDEHIQALLVGVKYSSDLDTLANLSHKHLSKLLKISNPNRENVVGVIEDYWYLEKNWKESILQTHSSLSPESTQAQELNELMSQELEIDCLKTRYEALGLKPLPLPKPSCGTKPVQKVEEVQKSNDLSIYLAHYFGDEGLGMLEEFVASKCPGEEEEVLQKIKKLAGKVPLDFREDFLLEFVSGNISTSQIDFYLSCIHVCNYFHIKVLGIVELSQLTPKDPNDRERVIGVLQDLDFEPLTNSLDVKDTIQRIVENVQGVYKAHKQISETYQAHNCFDLKILEVLKRANKEEMQSFAVGIDRMIDSLLTQFHPSLTTSTMHGNFGTGSGSMTKIIKTHLLNRLKKRNDETDKVYLKRISGLSFGKYLGNIHPKDIKNQPHLAMLVSACQSHPQEMMLFEYLQTITQVILTLELLQKNKLDLGPLAEYYEEILECELGKISIDSTQIK